MGLYDTKYFPDKFYVQFDVDRVENLLHLDENGQFGIELAVFIHEFYHYLANVTTFQGLRSFNVSFHDKIRIITIVQHLCGGLDGFPLFSNTRKNCKHLIEYWKDINDIVIGDSSLSRIAREIHESPSHCVKIKNIRIKPESMTVPFNAGKNKGTRLMVYLDVEGISTSSFSLPLAAIDEFLSSSIDEYLFQTDTTDNKELLQQRPYFPYLIFDDILAFHEIYRLDAKYKIIIAYKALHGKNPSVDLINIIKAVSKDQDSFLNDPCAFLEKLFHWNETTYLGEQLSYLYKFIQECDKQKRINLANASRIVYERGRRAFVELQNDPYYFIRPFIEDVLTAKDKPVEQREQFLKTLKNLLERFDGYLQLKGHELIDTSDDPEKNHLSLLLAISEILDGAEKYKLIERTVTKYDFDGEPGYDKIENLPDKLPLTLIWHNALNETSFYKLYLDYNKQQANSN